MCQPFPVLLQLLLLVGRMTLGAKDVSPFDPEAKEFHCCNAAKMDLWDPTCPDVNRVNCPPGHSCQFQTELNLTAMQVGIWPSTDAKGECFPAANPHLECQKISDLIVNCSCGFNDTFEQCNPLRSLQTVAYPFCPSPPGSNPKCLDTEDPDDLYCHYEVTQKSNLVEFHFDLKKHFCEGTNKFGKSREQLGIDEWKSNCTYSSEKTNVFDCKCVGINCAKSLLTANLNELLTAAVTTDAPTTEFPSTSSTPPISAISAEVDSDNSYRLDVKNDRLGARQIRSLNAETEGFSCCKGSRNPLHPQDYKIWPKVDLWDPKCPEPKQIQCGKDKSCQFNVTTYDGKMQEITVSELGHCVTQTKPSMSCSSTDNFHQNYTCQYGIGDTFDQTISVGFGEEYRKHRPPFCLIPPNQKNNKDPIRCRTDKDDPGDVFCHYKVTFDAQTKQPQYELEWNFCYVTTADKERSLAAKILLEKTSLKPSSCEQSVNGSIRCNCVGSKCDVKTLETFVKKRSIVTTSSKSAITQPPTVPVVTQPSNVPVGNPTTTVPVDNPTTTVPVGNPTTTVPAVTQHPTVPVATQLTEKPTKPTTTITPAPSDSGLSDGEIAGIVVGVILFLAIVGAALFYLRRKSKSPEIVALPPPPVDEEKIAEGQKAEESEDEDEDEDEDENEEETEGEDEGDQDENENENETEDEHAGEDQTEDENAEENENEDDTEAEDEESD